MSQSESRRALFIRAISDLRKRYPDHSAALLKAARTVRDSDIDNDLKQTIDRVTRQAGIIPVTGIEMSVMTGNVGIAMFAGNMEALKHSDLIQNAKEEGKMEVLRKILLEGVAQFLNSSWTKFAEKFLSSTGPPVFTIHQPIEVKDRKATVVEYCNSHDMYKVDFYRKAKVDRSQYYKWERGELRTDSDVDTRIRRLLAD